MRPEWEDISYQIIEQTGRVLHTHSEEAQSFTGIKPDKSNQDETIAFLKEQVPDPASDSAAITATEKGSYTKPLKKAYVDVAVLPVVTINLALIKDALRHKVTM